VAEVAEVAEVAVVGGGGAGKKEKKQIRQEPAKARAGLKLLRIRERTLRPTPPWL
jgi:hypothetical protein